MSNVFSVHQRTCLISHTSAYVGAIRRSVTGPELENAVKTFLALYHWASTRENLPLPAHSRRK